MCALTYQEAEDKGREEGSDEALPGLLGRQGDQRRTAEEEAPNECRNVVANNDTAWQQEPTQAHERRVIV